jgi:Uri superfamily endonuclease
VAEKIQQTHFLSNEEKAKWGKDFVERKTAVARMRVEDAETVMMQELNNMTTAENVGATTEKLETTVQEMLNHVGDNLSDLGSSDGEQDGEDKEDDEEDTELGKLGDDDEPGWVMGTIFKSVLRRIEGFWQKQTRLHKLTELGLGDATNYFEGET